MQKIKNLKKNSKKKRLNMNKLVLDACAVLALLKEEEGMDIVKNAIESDAEVFLHAVKVVKE